MTSIESAYDRGMADAYYMRKSNPHYYNHRTKIKELNEVELKSYLDGYEEASSIPGYNKEYD